MRFALRTCRTGAVAGAAALLCVAAGTAPAADGLSLDRQLQGLKDETLALNRDLDAIDRAARYPNGTRTGFYVAVNVQGFVLDGITVRMNDRDAAAHRYSETEARAFWKGGWHALQDVRVEPGTYHVQVDFRGKFWNAPPSEAPITGKLEANLTKDASEADFVLPISRASLRAKPQLTELARVKPADFNGGASDPRYRAALFLKNDGRYLSALTTLLDASRGDASDMPPEFRALLAESYVGFGMEQAAENTLRRLGTGALTARGELDLARLEYDRGYFSQALDHLQRVGGQLPPDLKDAGRAALIEAMMAEERYHDVVTQVAGTADLDSLKDLPVGIRYNLGVALIKDNRGREGRHQLDLVGTAEGKDADTLALRDKANLTLGYQYLKGQSGKNAKVAFSRVRKQGPFSNQALLGLGWAELALGSDLGQETAGEASGESLGALAQDTPAKSKGAPKAEAGAGTTVQVDEQKAMQKALVPWTELIQRDPMDPAVHEGLLAIAWTLDRLHSDSESINYYQHAIDTLETARKRMDKAKKAVLSGQMVYTMVHDDADPERGWKWRLTHLADTPETYFLQRMLAQHRFQETLKNYRDGLLLASNLLTWKERLGALSREGTTVSSGAQVVADAGMPSVSLQAKADAPAHAAELKRVEALLARVNDAIAAHKKQLEALSVDELDGQSKQVEKYLTESRASIARIYERQLRNNP